MTYGDYLTTSEMTRWILDIGGGEGLEQRGNWLCVRFLKNGQ